MHCMVWFIFLALHRTFWPFAFRFYALVFPAFLRGSSSSSAPPSASTLGVVLETISMGRAKGIYMPLWSFKGSPRLTFVCCFVFCDFRLLCLAWHIANLHAKTKKFIGPWLAGLTGLAGHRRVLLKCPSSWQASPNTLSINSVSSRIYKM